MEHGLLLVEVLVVDCVSVARFDEVETGVLLVNYGGYFQDLRISLPQIVVLGVLTRVECNHKIAIRVPVL